jgi:DNA-binding beta-propeller fold protein YncE
MKRLTEKRHFYIAMAFVALIVALGLGQSWLERVVAQSQATVQAPMFEVDPMWPKPMPNNWVQGMTIGLTVDERDHVWVIHRANDEGGLDRTEYAKPPAGGPGGGTGGVTVSECCNPAPPVLEFDAEGNLVGHWGGKGQGYDWPESNHGIVVDQKGNVWIGGNGQPDSHILKFTRDGKFITQFGKANARRDPKSPAEKPVFVGNSNDPDNFGRVAKIFIDPKSNEAYVADGYLNKRVAVIDMDSGKIKRYWGAYGEKPDDAPMGRYNPDEPAAKQFRTPVHCAELSNDGQVYVCDRPNDRIQVFTKEGKFVKEQQIFPETLSDGSVWDIAFSRDPQQRFLYVADGANEHVYIVDRNSLEILSQFGTGGRQPGQFRGVHSIAVDSKGNIYTTETYTGKRLQKFVFKGMGAPQKGVPWPRKTDD